MKRPLATAGTAFLISLTVVFCFFEYVWQLAALFALLAAASVIFAKRVPRGTAFVMCVAVLACCAAGLEMCALEEDLNGCAGTKQNISAVVTKVEVYGDTAVATASVKLASGVYPGRINVRFYPTVKLAPGDKITAMCTFSDSGEFTDGGVLIYGKCRYLSVYRGAKSIPALAYRLKEGVVRALTSQLTSDEGSFAAAVLTGDKSLLSAEVKIAFSRSGISHILVVSGLHITLMINALFALLRRLRLGKLPTGLIISAFVAACFVFYGFSLSVVRAGIMSLVTLLAKLADRRADGFTSLSLAALIITLFEPRAVTEISFELSYACCFAIIVVFPRLKKNIDAAFGERGGLLRAAGKIVEALTLTATISAVTLPVIVARGMPFSVASPLCNLLTVWLLPLVLGLSVLTAAAYTAVPFGFMSNLFGLLLGVSSKFILTMAKLFSGFRYAAISVGAPYVRLWLALTAVLLALWFCLFRKRVKFRFAALCSAVMLIIGALSYGIASPALPVASVCGRNSFFVRDRGSTAIVMSGADRDDAEYLAAYLDSRIIDGVSYVIMINESSREASDYFKKAFPNADVVNGELPRACRVGEILIVASNECVFVDCRGSRLVLLTDGKTEAEKGETYYFKEEGTVVTVEEK